MDLCKSSLRLEKQKYSNKHNPTKILLARIAEQFIQDLQINSEKTEETFGDSQHGTETKGKFKETAEEDKEDFEETSDVSKKHKAALQIQKEENKMSNIILEMLETERNYVLDLEEVCSNYLPLARDPSKRISINIEPPKQATARRAHSCPAINQSHDQQTEDSPPQVDRKKMRELLGNIEDLKDYHKKVILPQLEHAYRDPCKMRTLFECEKSKLSMKYGRYCINSSRSASIIKENLLLFSRYQHKNGQTHRLDALLIKPIQRITRYHMFLSNLARTSTELGNADSSADYSAALDAILSVTEHTNTMMWIGEIKYCPLILCGQGPLLKHGRVLSKKIHGSFKNRNKWPCHLLLFQQTLVLCKIVERPEKEQHPDLEYFKHVCVNHIQGLISESSKTFRIQKLEIEDQLTESESLKSNIIMRLEFDGEVENNIWMKTIMTEIEQLKSISLRL